MICSDCDFEIYQQYFPIIVQFSPATLQRLNIRSISYSWCLNATLLVGSCLILLQYCEQYFKVSLKTTARVYAVSRCY